MSSRIDTEALWIAIVAGVASAVTAVRFVVQLGYGPGWDAYTFLLNALEYAGEGNQGMEIYRPPLLPFLVSLFNRAGVDAVWPPFLIDGLFTIAGVVGLYLVLRFALSRPVSTIGALAFIALPDTIENLTAGITDLMSVAISVWLVYFLLKALRDDPSWLRWSILMVPLAFMTRFTGGMMLAVIIFGIVYDGRVRVFLRPARQGIAYSAVLLVPYFAYHWWIFGDPFIQIWEPFRAATATTRVGMLAGAIEPSSFFIANAPNMMSAAPVYGYALLGVLVLGLLLAGADVWSRRREDLPRWQATVLVTALPIIVYLIAGPTSFSVAVLAWIVVLGVLLPRWLVRDRDDQTMVIVVALFWLVLYLSIHSHMLVKVTRYYLMIAPPAMLFFAYPLERVRTRMQDAGATGTAGFAAACLSLAAVITMSGIASFERLENMSPVMSDFSGYEATRDWADANIPADETAISSDAFPHFRYRLRRAVWPMPPLKGAEEVARWLDLYGIDYFFTIHGYDDMDGFEVAFARDDVSVYRRTEPPKDRDEILLIGRAVNRHLDEVLGLEGPYIRAYLNMIPDDYSSTEGTYIDEFTLEDLAEYDAVYLYRFRWHDRSRAEQALRDYVSTGGTVIIDATGNLGNPPADPYGLEATTFLDVWVWRSEFPQGQHVQVFEPALQTTAGDPEFGRFTDESGGIWRAASYDPLETGDLRVLATYGTRPIVSEQTIGTGRVVWVAGNLGFHAYLRGTSDEHDFVRALLAYATDTADTGATRVSMEGP